MRQATRAIVLAFLGFLSAVVVGVAAVMTAAITLAATALIVPGTGTHNIVPPNAVTGYMENARARFIAPADSDCPNTNSCVLQGVPYPASFWPIPLPGWCPGLSCDTWNESVGKGVTTLDNRISDILNPVGGNPDEHIVLFGYSQGGQVVTEEMYKLAQEYPDKLGQFKVVTIGNIGNPNGLWARFNFLPGLTIPIFNVTFGPQLPTKGIESTNYVFEYDPVGDAPLNWWNGLAVLNALAAFQYVHGNYLVPNSNDPTGTLPYGYTNATLAQTISGLLRNCTEGPGSNCRTYQDAKFVLIPWQGTLPLLQPIVDLAAATGTTPIVKPITDLIQPVLKVLIDLGYDRTANPGIPRTLNLIPIFNPIKLAVDLVVAAGQGIQAFIKDITGAAPAPAPPLAPSGPMSTFATVEDNTAKLAQTDQTESTELPKLDLKTPLRRHAPDTSVMANPLKIDPKPDADLGVDPKPLVDITPRQPAPDADGSSNPVFNLPKLPKPTIGSTTAPKLPKMSKPINPLRPRVTELFPTLRGAHNGPVGTETTTDPGAGEQQGSPPSDSGERQAAA